MDVARKGYTLGDKIKPLGDRVVLEASEKEEMTRSGIVLPDTAKEKPQEAEVIAVGADSKSSMAFDLESGHPSEIDHINGAVCAAGRRTGVATPYNDAMVRLIKARETMTHQRTPSSGQKP